MTPPLFPIMTTTATAMTLISRLGKLMADQPMFAGAVYRRLSVSNVWNQV